MDPNSPVVLLVADGMRAESEGRADAAHDRFQQAWDAATDDYESCIAAHSVARHQNTPADTLRWNRECLDRADRVGDAPEGPYRNGIRFAVAAGLRSGSETPQPGPGALGELLTKLCARADLMALGVLLPPYLGDLGTAADRTALLTALGMVLAARSLPDDELALLRRAMDELGAPAGPDGAR